MTQIMSESLDGYGMPVQESSDRYFHVTALKNAQRIIKVGFDHRNMPEWTSASLKEDRFAVDKTEEWFNYYHLFVATLPEAEQKKLQSTLWNDDLDEVERGRFIADYWLQKHGSNWTVMWLSKNSVLPGYGNALVEFFPSAKDRVIKDIDPYWVAIHFEKRVPANQFQLIGVFDPQWQKKTPGARDIDTEMALDIALTNITPPLANESAGYGMPRLLAEQVPHASDSEIESILKQLMGSDDPVGFQIGDCAVLAYALQQKVGGGTLYLVDEGHAALRVRDRYYDSFGGQSEAELRQRQKDNYAAHGEPVDDDYIKLVPVSLNELEDGLDKPPGSTAKGAARLLNRVAQIKSEGAQGDWESEGYVLSHKEVFEYDRLQLQLTMHKDGERVGVMDVLIQDEYLYPLGLKVKEEHRRKGIANAFYAEAEKLTGKKFERGIYQSDDGKALWAQPNRLFGKKDETKIMGMDKDGFPIEISSTQEEHAVDLSCDAARDKMESMTLIEDPPPPQIIDPTKFDKEQVAKFYAALISDSRTQVIEKNVYENADLVSATDRFAVLDHTKKEVTYYMRWSERKIRNIKTVYQNSVWRALTFPRPDIPSVVFFEYLLPKFGIVCTDQMQTDLGKGFWRRAIGIALGRNLHVTYVDMSKPNVSQPITNQQEFDAVVDEVWGDKPKNQFRLMVISLAPLDLGKK